MSDEKTYRNVPFDGKTSSYTIWSKKFLSLCAIKGCDKVLTKDFPNMPSETATLDPTNDAELIELRKKNKLAYSMSLLSQNDVVSLDQITSGVTADLPSGSARKAWQNLERIH